MVKPKANPNRLQQYFREYEAFHRTKGNKLCHYFGIFVITITLLGLLARIRLGAMIPDLGICLWTGGVLWYLSLDRKIALLFGLFGIGCYALGRAMPLNVLWVSFGVAWVVQLFGHYYFEKRAPAFFHNLQHLLIGPLWLFCHFAHLSPTDAPTHRAS